MPTTISVSPAVPDKLVVNGVDLLNREELSNSQNKELQRYIDAHAHLLGFLDKEKEGEQNKVDADSLSSSRLPSYSTATTTPSYDAAARLPPPRATAGATEDDRWSSTASQVSPLQARSASAIAAPRAGSPYSLGGASDYGSGKRKGVSWSDVNVIQEQQPLPASPNAHHARARSNSPPPAAFYQQQQPPARGYDDDYVVGGPRYYAPSAEEEYGRGRMSGQHHDDGGGYGGPRQNYDRHRNANPFDREDGWGSHNPWTGSLDHHGRRRGGSRERPAGWQGFAKPDLPTYSALERKPDDFNPFQTHLHREEAKGLRRSQEPDDVIKFHSYGDHRVSGLELKPKGWTGGEVVTDPNIMKKSLKPRRFYYSPIGDGVVAADGVEMWRPPPDLTPRKYVYHQRYVEQDPGQTGIRVSEKTWHEGEPRDDDDGTVMKRWVGPDRDDGRRRGPGGPPADDDGAGLNGPPAGNGLAAPKWPGLDDDGSRRGPRRRWGEGLGPDDGGAGPRDDTGAKPGKFPLLEGLEGPGRGGVPSTQAPKGDDDAGRPISAFSTGSGIPREGWQKEWITNPRELINQYGTETLTTIFDYEDHTPKTYTTMKETWSPAPQDSDLPPETEEVQ